MLYTSIDIETSGKNPERHQVLSIGAIIEDTTKQLSFEETPKFKAIILNEEILGEPRALEINKNIINLTAEYLESNIERRKELEKETGYKFFRKDEIVKNLYYFLYQNGYKNKDEIINTKNYVDFVNGEFLPIINGNTSSITINVAGKNFATFDKPFLERLLWWQKLIKVRQRILDPAILFVDWENDETLPSLNECKQRANIEGEVLHDCLEDAWDVILTLRNKVIKNGE